MQQRRNRDSGRLTGMGLTLAAPLLALTFATGQATAQPAPTGDPSPAAAPARPSLELSPDTALKVARQVWRNETGANYDAITAWNAGEDFPSLGIGHFIWFPRGVQSPFDESFPDMMRLLKTKGAKLPAWLDREPFPPAPWSSREEFRRQFKSSRMVELRKFLHANFAGQAQFLVMRMQAALDRILATIPDPSDQQHVKRQYDRVVRSSPSLYPLIDYVSFKGEGIKETEAFPNPNTGAREGWGLKQVLLAMKGEQIGQAALDDFSEATKAMIRRRVTNRPSDKRWLAGWINRCDSYRRQLQ